MGKIALFLPKEEMLYQAYNLLQELNMNVKEVKVTKPDGVLEEAQKAVEDGISIIVSRGMQASLLKQHMDIPVVEIVMSAQEMGLLVKKAKNILGKEYPRIGVVGFRNMFCDMSYFNQLYDIDFRTYFVDQSDEIQEQVRMASEDGCDIVIGGEAVLDYARQYQVRTLYLS